MIQKTILLATTNPGKLRELQQIMGDLAVNWLTLNEVGALDVPEEIGKSFEEIAANKALHYARQSQLWALADDSGLMVDALGGHPGIHSARFSDPGATTERNNQKLIAELAHHPGAARSARFCCAVALATQTEVLATATGFLSGEIVDHPRGTRGFGYDPHFLVVEAGVTLAEMPPAQKNLISHRSRALHAIRPAIERLLQL